MWSDDADSVADAVSEIRKKGSTDKMPAIVDRIIKERNLQYGLRYPVLSRLGRRGGRASAASRRRRSRQSIQRTTNIKLLLPDKQPYQQMELFPAFSPEYWAIVSS